MSFVHSFSPWFPTSHFFRSSFATQRCPNLHLAVLGGPDASLLCPNSGVKLLTSGASAGEAGAGKDVQPLHHAQILMGYNVAVRNKAPDGLRRKMDPKGDRPDRVIVDIWLWEFRCRGVR